MQFLLQDFSFQARHRLLRVFKVCCLIVGTPGSVFPSVTFDLSGSALSWENFHDCLLLVQSYVLSAGYSHQSLFSDHTMKTVRDAVLIAGTFFMVADFDLWNEFCGSKLDSFVGDITLCILLSWPRNASVLTVITMLVTRLIVGRV